MKDDRITDPFYLLVQREINRIDRKENTNKTLYYIFRVLQILIAGVITVTAAQNQQSATGSEPLSQTTLLGALITALTAIETLFLFGVKKDIYTKLLFELRDIRAELIFLIYTSGDEISRARISKDDYRAVFDKYKLAKGLITVLHNVQTSAPKKDSKN